MNFMTETMFRMNLSVIEPFFENKIKTHALWKTI